MLFTVPNDEEAKFENKTTTCVSTAHEGAEGAIFITKLLSP